MVTRFPSLTPDVEISDVESETEGMETALIKTDISQSESHQRQPRNVSTKAHQRRRGTNRLRTLYFPLIIAVLILGLFVLNARHGSRQQDMLARFEQMQAVNEAQMTRMENHIERERSERLAAEEKLEAYREEKWRAREELEAERQKYGLTEGWKKLSTRQKVTVATAGAASAGSLAYYGKKALEYAVKGNPALSVAGKLLPVAVNYVANMVVVG